MKGAVSRHFQPVVELGAQTGGADCYYYYVSVRLNHLDSMHLTAQSYLEPGG